MYFTKSRLRSYTANESILKNSLNLSEAVSEFDIFLSHSYADKEYIVELKRILENYGYSVYVDWITDGKTLSRDNVSKDTAELIRKRMKQSKSMILVLLHHCLLFLIGLKNIQMTIGFYAQEKMIEQLICIKKLGNFGISL